MNRYAALGLVLDAYEGKRIIVLSPSLTAARDARNECARSPFAETADVTSNPEPGRMMFPSGGMLRFQPVRSSLRGLSADVVFIDEEADRRLSSYIEYDELQRDLRLVTVQSRDDSPVIRA